MLPCKYFAQFILDLFFKTLLFINVNCKFFVLYTKIAFLNYIHHREIKIFCIYLTIFIIVYLCFL